MISLLVALTISTTLAPPVWGCRPLVLGADVVPVAGGWVVFWNRKTALVHEWDAGASGDDQYWGCWVRGELRELKVPPQKEE